MLRVIYSLRVIGRNIWARDFLAPWLRYVSRFLIDSTSLVEEAAEWGEGVSGTGLRSCIPQIHATKLSLPNPYLLPIFSVDQ
jgi:hypothetical protein